MWRPEVDAATVILAPAPPPFATSQAIPTAAALASPLGAAAVRARSDDGDHLIYSAEGGAIRVWLTVDAAGAPLAVVVPLDVGAEGRLGAALRFVRRLRGRRAGPPPDGMAITAFQRHRLALLLNVLDAVQAGAGRREIARALLYPSLDQLTNAEWKDSPERRHVRRLCEEARALMRGGYRALLRGAPRTRGR